MAGDLAFVEPCVDDVPATLTPLTARERQVVLGTAAGMSSKEVAFCLGISDSTARVLLARAYARLNVRSRREMLSLPAVRALGRRPG